MDLALNNLQRLMCHKTQTNKPFNPKVNVIGWLEIELANYVVTVQHCSHDATRNLLPNTFCIDPICVWVWRVLICNVHRIKRLQLEKSIRTTMNQLD